MEKQPLVFDKEVQIVSKALNMFLTFPHAVDDIINLPHHVSSKHPKMSMYNRAAQFSPFAALIGYEKANEEARKKQEESVRRRNAPVDESGDNRI